MALALRQWQTLALRVAWACRAPGHSRSGDIFTPSIRLSSARRTPEIRGNSTVGDCLPPLYAGPEIW